MHLVYVRTVCSMHFPTSNNILLFIPTLLSHLLQLHHNIVFNVCVSCVGCYVMDTTGCLKFHEIIKVLSIYFFFSKLFSAGHNISGGTPEDTSPVLHWEHHQSYILCFIIFRLIISKMYGSASPNQTYAYVFSFSLFCLPEIGHFNVQNGPI